MKRLAILLPLVGASVLGGRQAGQALRVASAFTAHQLCAQAFVAEEPVAPLFHDYVQPMIGAPVVKQSVRYVVDPQAREVRASILGTFTSRASYADGRGCTVLNGGAPPAPILRTREVFAERPLPAERDPRLTRALDRAFTPDRHAIVIVHDGRIVAERYAAGYGPETRMQSWSMAKSITNALIGILVRRGELALDRPVQGLPNGITLDQLLRQTSGQPFGSSYSGLDRASRMQFLERDTAAYAATTFAGTPGERWSYTDANYAILSGIIRRSVGGTPNAVARFADAELFGPAGMSSALLEFDESGNPMGADWAYASARDWARFGLLYAQDGIEGGRRVLPEGWTGYSASPTPSAPLGYGAGFWTNRGPSTGAINRRSWGMPADSYFALGNSGQIVLIAPAEHLVLVSLGYSLDSTNRTPVKAVAELAAAVLKP
jgi:CubicO group peptidase (beta-lactamase class C family)